MKYAILEEAAARASRNLHAGNWCRFSMAQMADGRGVGATSDLAVRWCAAGRLTLELHRLDMCVIEIDKVFMRGIPALGMHGSSLAQTNDDLGMDEARDLLLAISIEAGKVRDDEIPA